MSFHMNTKFNGRRNTTSHMGRTARKRKRKPHKADIESINFHNEIIIWTTKNGLKMNSLTPTNFKATGRGLKTTRSINIPPGTTGSKIISVPRPLLITFDTVWNSSLKGLITNPLPHRLSVYTAFTLFLMLEKRKGSKSPHCHYINSVPKHYTTPAWIPSKYSSYLPNFIEKERESQIEIINDQLKEIYKALEYGGNNNNHEKPTFEDALWANSIVNTRSVYLSPCDLKCSTTVDVSIIDFAMAPVLDMLNHNYNATISSHFSPTTNCYEIKTMNTYKPGEQVFINYGPHSNRKLYCQYGFYIPDNIHAFIPVSLEKLKKHFGYPYQTTPDILTNTLNKLNVKTEKIGFTTTGPDWSFNVTSHLLCTTNETLTRLKPCVGPCVILSGCKTIIHELISEHRETLKNLSCIDNETVQMAAGLLLSEIKVLEKILASELDENCSI